MRVNSKLRWDNFDEILSLPIGSNEFIEKIQISIEIINEELETAESEWECRNEINDDRLTGNNEN